MKKNWEPYAENGFHTDHSTLVHKAPVNATTARQHEGTDPSTEAAYTSPKFTWPLRRARKESSFAIREAQCAMLGKEGEISSKPGLASPLDVRRASTSSLLPHTRLLQVLANVMTTSDLPNFQT